MNKWDAKAYSKYSKSQELWAKELLKKIVINKDDSILDIGCGDGKITNLLSNLTSSTVTGIDFSEDMIRLAKVSYEKPIFTKMDAQKMNFIDEFDIVFSNAALHWIEKHETVLYGIYSGLKSQGKILLQMGGEGNASMIFKALENLKIEYGEYFKDFVFPYSFHSDSYYLKLLKKVGFVECDVKLIPKDMIHDNMDAFKGWLETTWFPYLQCIPEDIRGIFLQKWVELYLDLVPLDNNSQVHVSMIRLEVKAQKGK